MTPNLPQEKKGKAQWDHLEGLSLPFLHTHRDRRRKLPTTAFQRGGRATYPLPPQKKKRERRVFLPFKGSRSKEKWGEGEEAVPPRDN